MVKEIDTSRMQWVKLGLGNRRRAGHVDVPRKLKVGELVKIEDHLHWNWKKEYWEVLEVGNE